MTATNLRQLGIALLLAAFLSVAFFSLGERQPLSADSPPAKPTGLKVTATPGSLSVSVD